MSETAYKVVGPDYVSVFVARMMSGRALSPQLAQVLATYTVGATVEATLTLDVLADEFYTHDQTVELPGIYALTQFAMATRFLELYDWLPSGSKILQLDYDEGDLLSELRYPGYPKPVLSLTVSRCDVAADVTP